MRIANQDVHNFQELILKLRLKKQTDINDGTEHRHPTQMWVLESGNAARPHG